MACDPAHWRVPTTLNLRSRRWDAQVVVFNTHSGDTFLLDELSWQALDVLREGGPLTSEAVANRLSLGSEQAPYIDDRLEELRLRGLLERVALC